MNRWNSDTDSLPQKGPIIKAVDTFSYWCPYSIKPQLVVKVSTTDGIDGWGEAGYTFREEAVIGAIAHLRDIIIGRDAFEINALWQEMYRRAYFEGCRATAAAISAIDVALHDIKGKALNVPVYDLIGGIHRSKVTCFGTTSGSTPEQTLASARDLAFRGFSSIRLHVLPLSNDQWDPFASIAPTSEAVILVREMLGAGFQIGIDYHHRLSIADAMAFCERVPKGYLDYIEEPIRAQSKTAYEALRSMTGIPFAIGEEYTSKWEFYPFLHANLIQFARIDLGNVGGFTEARKVAAMCEANYIDVMPHNPLGPINTAATIHFAAALDNFAILEARAHQIYDPLGIDEHIYPDQPLLTGNMYSVPQGPGLGIKVDEVALREEVKSYRHGHSLKLLRSDGSYTNS